MTDLKSQTPRRPSKKSEMLEVRLDYESKQEFLAACQAAGRTASDVVREQIAAFVAQANAPMEPDHGHEAGRVLDFVPAQLRRKRWAAAGIGAVGLAMAVALPSAAAPGAKAPFEKLDRNHDGQLSPEEYDGRARTDEHKRRDDEPKQGE